MNSKAQELELRNIMQGLEEFATFMSFQGNTNGLRIISVETVTPVHEQQPELKQKAQVLPIKQQNATNKEIQTVRKSLSFQDRKIH
ncbi:MAG: hypothetical protein DRQ40_06350 [Gammaproteobacteria bacterium]|nr:MAG: hypothetical protein DRQ40_06350 [Gammaproteobacteria bacterium]